MLVELYTFSIYAGSQIVDLLEFDIGGSQFANNSVDWRGWRRLIGKFK